MISSEFIVYKDMETVRMTKALFINVFCGVLFIFFFFLKGVLI
jgi:hypothetical protein